MERIDAGDVVVLTRPSDSPAAQNAIRRAARRLEQVGKVKITSVRIEGVARLVAAPPTADVPPPRIVTGLNGKTYMMPSA